MQCSKFVIQSDMLYSFREAPQLEPIIHIRARDSSSFDQKCFRDDYNSGTIRNSNSFIVRNLMDTSDIERDLKSAFEIASSLQVCSCLYATCKTAHRLYMSSARRLRMICVSLGMNLKFSISTHYFNIVHERYNYMNAKCKPPLNISWFQSVNKNRTVFCHCIFLVCTLLISRCLQDNA